MAWKKYGKNDWRADALAAGGEFLGTFLFLLLGLAGIQAARDASPNLDAAFLLMAATSMAMALTFSVWIFFRVTGAAFNPNISLALLILGVISPRRFVFYVIAQLVGAIAASAVLLGILPGPLLVLTQRSALVGVAQALFWEMFLTAALTMVVIMTLVEKNKTTILAPIAIGFALFATQLAGIQYTGAAVNTARAFGPAVVVGDFIGSHWIYWVGPSLGAALAAGLYKLLIAVHYWELTPGADAQHPHEADNQAKNPSRGPEMGQNGIPGTTAHNTAGSGSHNTVHGSSNPVGYNGAPSTGTYGNTGTTGTGHRGDGSAMHPTGHIV